MKNLTLEQANELLKTANTKQDIINILNKLNLSSPETNTILYSGIQDMDGFKDYLKKTNQYNNVRMIDKTSVGEFLNIWENKNLQNALTRAFGNGDPEFDVIEEYKKRGSADGKVPPSELNKFFHDAGKKDSGLWDIASKRFVSEIKGEVLTAIGDNALTTRTFYQTELPELLKNENITKINGIDKLEFAAKLNANVTDTNKLNFLKDNSKEYHINEIIKNDKISYADKIKDISDMFGRKNLPVVLNILDRAGIVGLALGAGVATYEANRAAKNGDSQKAFDIIGEYIAAMGGGYLTGKSALMALGGTVTLGTIALTTLIGIGGSELASYLYKNKDVLSYFFNPFDKNWQGKDPKWLEFFKSLGSLNQPLPSISDLHDLLINDPNGGISQDLADYILQTNRYNDSISIQIYDPLILDLNGNGKNRPYLYLKRSSLRSQR